MTLRSSSLRRGVMLAVFGVALLGFGSVAANAQYGNGYGYGRQNVRQHRHHDRCGHNYRVQTPVYYGDSGYYGNNGYPNNNGYYNNSRYNQRRRVYRNSGLSSLLRVVISGGRSHRRGH